MRSIRISSTLLEAKKYIYQSKKHGVSVPTSLSSQSLLFPPPVSSFSLSFHSRSLSFLDLCQKKKIKLTLVL